jgi:hypothetical protein
MSMSVRLRLGGMIAAAALVLPVLAGAATVDLDYTRFDRSQLGAARDAMAQFRSAQTIDNLHVETFKDYKAWGDGTGTQDLRNTAVGSFTAFGEKGSGGAKVGNGADLQVRGDSSMPWGRYSTATDLIGGHWLDSNDNLGVKWQIEDVGTFDTVAFFVTDVSDVGGKFSIKVGGTLYEIAGQTGRLANGTIHFVKILLDEAVDSLTVELMHDRANDGFGIDGAIVGRVAPVPLPPAMLLLGAGIAALAGVRRRALRAA